MISVLSDAAACAALALGVVNTVVLLDTRAAITRLAFQYRMDRL